MVLYENAQWRVTDFGMQSVPPETHYEFGADRLTETAVRDGGIFYDWPVHLAEKTWVNISAFNDAFTRALQLHAGRFATTVDSDLLARSLSKARSLAAKR